MRAPKWARSWPAHRRASRRPARITSAITAAAASCSTSPTTPSWPPSAPLSATRCGASANSTSRTLRSSKRPKSGATGRKSRSPSRPHGGPATGFPAVALERTNPEMDRLARRWAAEQLGAVRGQAVWDLYGGVGDTAVLLAERGAQVVSVDADEAAVDWARRRPTVIPVRFVAARAEHILPTLPAPQGVGVPPPKEGLHWDGALRLTGDA